jgi:HEAT repeat protein
VLLVGRPGSGKSTALVRLLVATAQQALQNPHSQIPVLVELRTYNIYYKTSVLDLVQASLKRRKLRLDIEALEDLLAEGQFLLLMDGINELPDDEARRTIKEFRLDYSDVPMVFTTRDLGVGGDLGIEKKLEMQSLTEAEVEKFVRECLPGGSQQTLQQLRQRLRELGQTPFVMWMLYFIVQKTGTVPSGAGSAFREFTQLYERRSKDDAPVSEESRRWWSRLLEHLGFEMMQAEKPTDFRLTISKREAEDILTKVLDSEKFDKPRDYALRWLEDLLKHHLIQVTSNDQIEFCHQLIQEYYAAEILLKVLTSPPRRTSPPTPLLGGEGSKIVPPFPGREGGLGGLGLSDDELKRDYLNYLKWTEPLALMLELVEDKAQVVRVVKLALEVDLQLGASLAGAVKPEWQEQTVGLVAGLEVPQQLKNQLLSKTLSNTAVSYLLQVLDNQDSDVRQSAAKGLGEIGSDAAIPRLIQALEQDENSDVRGSIATALGKIGSEAVIPSLFQTLANRDEEFGVRLNAAIALGQVGNKTVILALLEILFTDSLEGWMSAATALSQIDSKQTITELSEALEQGNADICQRAAYTLGAIGDEAAIPILIKLLEDRRFFSIVRSEAAKALGNIRSFSALPSLLSALNDEDYTIRASAIAALGNIGDTAVTSDLLQALQDNHYEVRQAAAQALGQVGDESVVPVLIQVLESQVAEIPVNTTNLNAQGQVENAQYQIGGLEAELEVLKESQRKIQREIANNQGRMVQLSVVMALGKLGSKIAVPALIKLLENDVHTIFVIHSLGQIASDSALPSLLQAFQHGDSTTRASAAFALGQISSDTVVPELLQALNDNGEESDVIKNIAYALGKVGDCKLILPLSNLLSALTSDDVIDNILNAISTLQERCKFYNYTLTQPPQMEDKPKSEVKRDQVFISYSHKDKKTLEKLQTMLKPMMRNDTILVWDDTKIQAGAKWRDEIEKALARANVAVLMVSANFLASDFIAKHELPPLLNAAEQEGLKVIWVPVGYCLYEETEIEQYQAVHNPSQPLESLKGAKLNEVLAKICRAIKAASTATT